MKVFLIIVGVLVLLLGGVVVAGVWWWNSNEEAITQQVEAAAEQAMAVAQSGDSLACVEAAKQRVNECSGLTCQVAHQLFMQGCLEQAPVNPALCEAVNNTGFSQWTAESCLQESEIQACSIALAPVGDFCAAQATP